MESFWGSLGCSWAPFGRLWGAPGLSLELSGALLGCLWGSLIGFLPHPGGLWGLTGAIFVILASFATILDVSLWFCVIFDVFLEVSVGVSVCLSV